ncbi:hypothetical protein BKA69DRAFT_1046184 [Paraphysoderma sedebokerense]|nr:hypothetical protein BKA69DRAFT_1046184 [Paraphysoderma sedebokerense]
MDPVQGLLHLRISNFVASRCIGLVSISVSDIDKPSTSSIMAFSVIIADVISCFCYVIGVLLRLKMNSNGWVANGVGLLVGLVGEAFCVLLYQKRLQITEIATTPISKTLGIFLAGLSIVTSTARYPITPNGVGAGMFLFTLTKITIYVLDCLITFRTVLLVHSSYMRGISIQESLKSRTVKINFISFILNMSMIIVRFSIVDVMIADYSVGNYMFLFEHFISSLFFLIKLDKSKHAANGSTDNFKGTGTGNSIGKPK